MEKKTDIQISKAATTCSYSWILIVEGLKEYEDTYVLSNFFFDCSTQLSIGMQKKSLAIQQIMMERKLVSGENVKLK